MAMISGQGRLRGIVAERLARGHGLGIAALAALALATGLGGAALARTIKADQPTLEQRVQAVEDRFALENLLAAYSKAIDARDWHAYAAVFSDEATFGEGPNAAKGRAAIEARLRAMMTPYYSRPDAPKYLQHNVDTVSFEIHGDMATGFHHWQVVGATASGVPVVTEAGHYEDVYRRENGRWLIFSRKVLGDIGRAPAGSPWAAGSAPGAAGGK